MIARISKALNKKDGDKGFTLIELLVVIIIIGILSAIAIPVFLSQREKAVDSAAQADLSTIAKQIATAYVDNSAAVTVAADTANNKYTLTQDGTTTDIGPISGKVGAPALTQTPATGASAENFTVTLTYTGGKHTSVTYSATSGISTSDTPVTP